MAEVKVTYPASGLVRPSDWNSDDGLKQQLKDIWKNNKGAIEFASAQSNIPKEVVVSFIAVESGGKTYSKFQPDGAVTQGLMQWNRNHAKKQLETELSLKRLSEAEKKKLAEYKITFDSNGMTRVITNADQKNEPLNILIGSIILGQLIDTDWGTENGEIKLERVISVYNAGAYGDTGKKARSKAYKTPLALANVVNFTSRSYIAKILGKGGALDFVKQHNILA